MTLPEEYSFIRYLAAKKSVDDRALNRHVWETLKSAISSRSTGSPVRVLEIGAGIGTMVERLLDWKLTDRDMEINAIDLDPQNIAEAHRRVAEWGRKHAPEVREGTDGQLSMRWPDRTVSVTFEAIGFSEFVKREEGRGRWNLLTAHAFLDLVNLAEVLPVLPNLLAERGLLYLTINFDAATIFEPPIHRDLDQKIEALYHQTMDQRVVGGKPSGESRTGRHLFGHLRNLGVEILDAGSSDWVVFPSANRYLLDEAYFLHHIVDTVDQALRGRVELEGEPFGEWVKERHLQIERRELVYIAHQIDILGQKSG